MGPGFRFQGIDDVSARLDAAGYLADEAIATVVHLADRLAGHPRKCPVLDRRPGRGLGASFGWSLCLAAGPARDPGVGRIRGRRRELRARLQSRAPCPSALATQGLIQPSESLGSTAPRERRNGSGSPLQPVMSRAACPPRRAASPVPRRSARTCVERGRSPTFATPTA